MSVRRVRVVQYLFCSWSRHLCYLRQTVGTGSSLSGPLYKSPHISQQRGVTNRSKWNPLHDNVRQGVTYVDDDDYDDDDDDDDDDGYDTDDFVLKVRTDTNKADVAFDKAVGRLPAEQEILFSQVPDSPKNSRVVRVSIIGAPNSGKSTLINNLMGWKVNGVSSKVHTTEKNAASIYTRGNKQIVFIDTPGVMSPEQQKRHHCKSAMQKAPRHAVIEADIIGVIIDCANRWERNIHDQVLEILHDNADKPSFLILNKIDLLKHPAVILSITRQLTDGIVGNKSFGKPDVKKHSETIPENMWADKQGFEKLFSKLEKTYGRLSFPFANESNSNSAEAVIRPLIKQYDKLTDKNSEAVIRPLFNGYDKQTNKTNNRTKVDPSTQLEEDSYQKGFIEEILSRQTLDGDRKSENIVENPADIPDGEAGIWIRTFEEKKKRSLEFKLRNYWTNFDCVFPVSALTGDGMGYLAEFVEKQAKPSPWLYHSSVVTNQDPMEIAKMCVRQALLDNVSGYLPYTVEINIAYWEVNENNQLDIVMEVITKNSYEMDILFGKTTISSDFKRDRRRPFNSDMNMVQKAFIEPKTTIAEIAAQTKQALLDVFRCEIKFQLALRLDKKLMVEMIWKEILKKGET